MLPSREIFAAFAVLSISLASRSVAAQTPQTTVESPNARPQSVDLVVRRERLPNGLRVVLQEDHFTPSVAICVTYHVGARNERTGQAGFAHLFEQMMFEGSRNVPKGDHFGLIAARGGVASSTTTSERTAYVDRLPASDLALGLWLEADRMKTLALTERKLDTERAIVHEEYRTRVSNNAYAFGEMRLRELAFQGYAPYDHSAIGTPEDVDRATVEWVRQFHEDYYAPNNAVLTVTGDFDSQAALALITEYFGDAAPQPTVPAFVAPPIPRQTSERLSVVEDTNAKNPGIYYGWITAPARTPEHAALELAAAVLAEGEGASLPQLLVRDKEVAREVSAALDANTGPNLLSVRMLVSGHSSVDALQKLFESELRRLQVVGPTDVELQRAKQNIRSRFLMNLQSNENRALLLGDFETLWGDASFVNAELSRYDAVSAKDVRQAAATMLTDSHRSIVEVYPPGWLKEEYPAVLARTHIVRKGDTFLAIAKQYNVEVADILRANKMRRAGTLHPGDKLIIPKSARTSTSPATATKSAQSPSKNVPPAPAMRSYAVKKGDTLGNIARKFGVTVSSIAAHNNIRPKQRLAIGQKLVIPPAEHR